MQYRPSLLTLALHTLALQCVASAAWAHGWRTVGDDDGVRVEVRRVDGMAFSEIRVLAHTAASVESLCEAAWGDGKAEPDEPNIKHREVLEEAPNMRIAYEQVSVPVVADRDYVVKTTKTSEAGGRCRVSFENVADRGPKPQPGYVRIPRFYGSWTFEATDNGSFVTYVVYSDPGGGVPATLAQGPQREAAKEWMRTILEKARRAEPRAMR